MCVIAVKPKGVNLPSEETLKKMWDNNSDGAGYMYNLDGKVHIKKGFMKFEDLKASIDNTYRMLTNKAINAEDVSFIYHFRIATHGTVLPQNTHPYPISDNIVDLGALETETDLAMAHNGVIGKMDIEKESDITDTATFVKDVVTPFYKYTNNTFLKNKNVIETLESVIGASRLSFLDGEGNITKVGNWKDGEDGLCYSNLNHTYTYTRAYNYNTYLNRYHSSLDNVYLKEIDFSKFDVEVKMFAGKSDKISVTSDEYYGKTFKWYMDAQGEFIARKISVSSILYMSDKMAIYKDYNIFSKGTKNPVRPNEVSDMSYHMPSLEYTSMIEKEKEVTTTVVNTETLSKLKAIPKDLYYLVRWTTVKGKETDYSFTEITKRNQYFIAPDNTIYKKINDLLFSHIGVVGDGTYELFIGTEIHDSDYSYTYDNIITYNADTKKTYKINKTKTFKNKRVI